MDRISAQMKANVWEMNTIDAMQMVLDFYDADPKSKDPAKLYNNVPISLVALDSSKLPKNTTDGNFIDLTLGELLGLTMMGAYYQNDRNKGYKVIVGLDDISKPGIEHIISDGAIRAFDQSSRMIFQQVSAQSYHLESGLSIENQIINAIKDKESKREIYPEKCALLVNVYGPSGGFFIRRILEECNMHVFDIYFLAVYELPNLGTCRIFYLDTRLNCDQVRDRGITFSLERKK
jgi:hypothetical protein